MDFRAINCYFCMCIFPNYNSNEKRKLLCLNRLERLLETPSTDWRKKNKVKWRRVIVSTSTQKCLSFLSLFTCLLSSSSFGELTTIKKCAYKQLVILHASKHLSSPLLISYKILLSSFHHYPTTRFCSALNKRKLRPENFHLFFKRQNCSKLLQLKQLLAIWWEIIWYKCASYNECQMTSMLKNFYLISSYMRQKGIKFFTHILIQKKIKRKKNLFLKFRKSISKSDLW